MEQEQINYQDVIDLGFEREDHYDTVFFEHNGYNWFTVELILSKRFFEYRGQANYEVIYADWDCRTHKVEIVRMEDKDGVILGEIKIKTLDELKKAIEFYSD